MGSKRRVEVAMDLVHETDDAYLLSDGTGPQSNVWVPKSVCEIDSFDKQKKSGVFLIEEWFAEKEGLI